MAREKGYAPVDRNILDDPIWTREVPFDDRSALVDIILRVNYKSNDFKPKKSRTTIIIHANQIFLSYDKLCDRWMWSKGKVMRFLKSLEEDGVISLNSSESGTMLTLIKYRIVGNQRTDSRTDSDTDDDTDYRTDDETAYDTDSDTDSRTVGSTRLNKDKNNNKGNKGLIKENKEKEIRFDPGGYEIEE